MTTEPPKNTPKLDRKKGLYLKAVAGKGRGVFCTQDIAKGDILEVTPALLLNEEETTYVDQTLLQNYTFVTGEISRKLRSAARLKSTESASSAVFGILSFCNHGKNPNAEVLWQEYGDTLYYILHATRAIPKNTEICTTYGDDWFEDRNTQGV